MAIELTLSIDGPVEFKPGLPAGYVGPVIPGAIAVNAKTNISQLVIQELVGDQFSIRLTLARFLAKVTAFGNIQTGGLYSFFMLKNGVRKEIEKVGRIRLREGQYISVFTPPASCKESFDKDADYRILDIHYSPELLSDLLPYFPELETFLQGSPAILLPGKAGYTFPSLREIVQEVLNCKFDEATCRFYFDLKVRELLFEIMVNAYRRKEGDRHFTPWEVMKLHQARLLLLDYVPLKPPILQSLAKQVALNVYKLKTGFRQYFKLGIFEWLMDQKMEEAKRLLLNTSKQVKEISAMVGYSRTTNFITAFRKRFGYPPGALRRK